MSCRVESGDMPARETVLTELEQRIVQTLCKHNLRVQSAAAELNYHRNSLAYQIQKIEEKTGLSCSSFFDVMALMELCKEDSETMREAKRDRFHRVAEIRTQKVLDALDSLGKCSAKASYEYTEGDVERILGAIEQQLEKVRARFEGRDRFTLDEGQGRGEEPHQLVDDEETEEETHGR